MRVSKIQNLENESEIFFLQERFLLTKTQAEEKLKNYEKIEQAGIHNLGLWLNLSQLYKLLGNESLAQEYLSKAKTIAPHIKYLEN